MLLILVPVSRKSRQLFGPEKLFSVYNVCIQDQSFHNFENDTMKLLINKSKLTCLWARNCVTIQQVLISVKIYFGPEKLSRLLRNGPQVY